jgi:hypothetical protein
MNSGAIRAMAVAITVSVAFLVLRRVLPIAPPCPGERPIDDLRKQYRKSDLGARLLLIALGGAAFWPLWRALRLLGSLAVPHVHDAVYVLTPSSLVWALPALVLGTIGASFLVDALLRHQLRDSYAEFVRYQNRRYGFDTARVERPIYLIVPAACLVGSALTANWYVYVTPHAIVVNPFFGVRETSLSFDRIDDIVTAGRVRSPIGKEIERREYAVRTRDGLSWNTQMDPSMSPAARKTEIVQYVSQQSGVPIREVHVLSSSDIR